MLMKVSSTVPAQNCSLVLSLERGLLWYTTDFSNGYAMLPGPDSPGRPSSFLTVSPDGTRMTAPTSLLRPAPGRTDWSAGGLPKESAGGGPRARQRLASSVAAVQKGGGNSRVGAGGRQGMGRRAEAGAKAGAGEGAGGVRRLEYFASEVLNDRLSPRVLLHPNPSPGVGAGSTGARSRPRRAGVAARAAVTSAGGEGPLLVTVLGKGGAGKTTASVLLAKYYAAAGKRTCLLLQSVDDYAETLLGCSISSTEFTPLPLQGGKEGSLCALRLETTKFLLEPLEALKEADERLGLTQGALAEVVGEELSVLPGMDAFAAIASIELLAKPGGGFLSALQRHTGGGSKGAQVGAGGGAKGKGAGAFSGFPWGSADADVVVFDGASSADTLRLLASPERGRWYLRRFRAVAEGTDAGRVALPSVARAIESSLALSTSSSPSSTSAARSSAEVWAKLDDVISDAVSTILNPRRVKVFLVTPDGSPSCASTALRLWGRTLQAGACVSGLLHYPSQAPSEPGVGPASESTFVDRFLSFSGLPLQQLPRVGPTPGSADVAGLLEGLDERVLLGVPEPPLRQPVTVDVANSSVSIFLPGFNKAEVKLQQWKGGSQLLVDAGDQRRCIDLPRELQGKIAGAKFVDGCLEVRTKK